MAKRWLIVLVSILAVLAAACTADPGSTVPDDAAANMPNPASAYCEDQGYTLEIVTADDGSQSGLCVFDDGSSCDEWAYFRGECGPASQASAPEEAQQTDPTAEGAQAEYAPVPTINPADYEGWWTYQHPVYGFSLLLPEDWTVREETGASTLSGHMVTLLPDPSSQSSIRLTFRRTGEDILLWPTGVGQGEFVSQGTLDISGVSAQRSLLVCPTGEITSIWYRGPDDTPAISLGDLEFAVIYQAGASHCLPDVSLSGKIQLVGEMIIASLAVQ